MSENDQDGDAMGDSSPAEQAEATRLAEAVDGLLRGEGIAPVSEIQQRDLLELSAAIQASHKTVELDVGRRDELIEAAIAKAMQVSDDAPMADIANLDDARTRKHWTLGLGLVLAAAALVFLMVRSQRPDAPSSVAVQEYPTELLSRPSDAVVGRIQPEASGEARLRIDKIYADRMAGYRSLRFRRMVGQQ